MNKHIYLLLAFVLFSCNNKQEELLFRNAPATETNIEFANNVTETEDLNILDYLYFYNGGGVAVGDINGDDLPDIFFSGNQVKNKLYLNQGNLKFKDVSSTAGVEGESSWNTGAVMGDVNGDGLLDIYVCAVVGINGFYGQNELYINNGDATFTEKATSFGLDYDTFSSSAAFIDYDLDGDLDIYLLNHAVHTPESYGKANTRLNRNEQTGDKLLRNDQGAFVDVSEEAGIFGGANGYGLGIAVSDFNQDGFPDIYVGNDFHEDDYYYLNNGDGTFTNQLTTYFGHTSKFSMGSDVADINHDGWPDLISLDMLPEKEEVLKSSEGSDNIQTIKMRTELFGYHYQYARNMLFVNQQNAAFSERAYISGVAATDWSWSALFADFNQDAEQDLFISNGIAKRPNNLDFINFVSSDEIKTKINNTKLVDKQALNMMPSGALRNYIFKGTTTNAFIDESATWIPNDTLKSGATAMADLDLDGDLDLIINNSNEKASILENTTNAKSSYLKLKLEFSDANKFGVGTKVFSYHNGIQQYKELYTVRGFQSSSEPIIHFGYGAAKNVDSLKIIWPNNSYQTVKNIAVNQTVKITPINTSKFNYTALKTNNNILFEKIDDKLGINFNHVEDAYIDFNRQKLMPYQIGDRGPATALGDLNNDGAIDIFFGSSKYHPSEIFVQKDSAYSNKPFLAIQQDSINEDISAAIADFNNDGKNDVLIGTGGGDFFNEMKPLLDSYYVQADTTFNKSALPEAYQNAAIIAPFDFDNDGDIDVFIGNSAVTNDFGAIPNSMLLENDKGTFTEVKNKDLQKIGMLTNAIWDDFNNDGLIDLIVVGEWMSPKFFKNNGSSIEEVDLLDKEINGLWQTIIPFDIDEDGDTDYVLGNWGENSEFKASNKYPMKMYYGDFDQNSQTETIVVTEKEGRYYPIETYDEITSQIVSLKKKFRTYKSFAGKSINEIFEAKILDEISVLEVSQLKSGYLKNEGGKFSFVPFHMDLQTAPILAFVKHDFNKDGKVSVLAAGNYFGVKPYQGRLDSFSGALITSEKDITLSYKYGLDLSMKSVRHLNILNHSGKDYLLVTVNNGPAEVYKIK